MRRLEKFEARTDPEGPAARESEPEEVGVSPDPAAPIAGTARVSAGQEPRPAVARAAGKVTIDLDLIERGQVSPEEREALIGFLEDLLFKVRRL